jgi:hypothetical protein
LPSRPLLLAEFSLLSLAIPVVFKLPGVAVPYPLRRVY